MDPKTLGLIFMDNFIFLCGNMFKDGTNLLGKEKLDLMVEIRVEKKIL